MSNKASTNPTMHNVAKMGICCIETLLKLPMPQMRKLCMFSTEARKLSKEMTEEVM